MKEALYIAAGVLLILIILYICFYKQVNVFIVAVTGKKRIQKKLCNHCKNNDLLIINDLWLPVGEGKFKHLDTIIFGNKYIYVTRIVKQIGEIKFSLDDQKWRVIYKNQLSLIDNPINQNKRIISYLLRVVEGIEEKDLKNLVVLSKTCKFNQVNPSDSEFIVSEKEAIKLILQIEENSNDDVIDPYEIERYAKSFYNYGLEAEKALKKYKRL